MGERLGVCQSCAKPLEAGNLGREADCSLSTTYCSACYADGQFTRNVSLAEMQEIVTASLEDKPIPALIKKRTVASIAGLQRWS